MGIFEVDNNGEIKFEPKFKLKKLGLTVFQLKWIAVISMILDHIGSIAMDGVIAPYKNGNLIYFTTDMPFLVRNSYIIKSFLDAFGCIAFPIFFFTS